VSAIFLASGFAEDLWKEKSQGTLRRLVATPHALAGFLAGKLAGMLVFTAPIAAAALFFGWAAFDLSAARLPLGYAWLVLAMALFWCLFAIVQLSTSSERAANITSNLILFPLLMIGGTFFPFEAMPDWMASIGRWTPNGWALTRFRALVEGGAGLGDGALGFAVLTAAVAAAFALAARRLSRRFVRS
jgi:ABC-type multidrug transport system permease subunit